jgi:hypothetical protein
VAEKDLKAGDEITVAYVDVTQHADETPADARKRRRWELVRGWRFACLCTKCLSDGVLDTRATVTVRSAAPEEAGEGAEAGDVTLVEPVDQGAETETETVDTEESTVLVEMPVAETEATPTVEVAEIVEAIVPAEPVEVIEATVPEDVASAAAVALPDDDELPIGDESVVEDIVLRGEAQANTTLSA